jgi:stage IV sporulation protein FB
MGSRGYLTVLRVRGVPVRLHWTLPLCALLAGRLEFVPALWLGFLLLVLIHEAGHALVVRLTGHEVLAIDVIGIGGLCRWDGEATPMQRSMIAWGGVWAQMALWVATQAVILAVGAPTTSFWAQMATAFTSVNVWIMLVNLLPIPPLDGAEAWPLFGMLWARWKRRRSIARTAARSAVTSRAPAPVQVQAQVPAQARARAQVDRSPALAEAARREEEALRAMDDVDSGLTPEVEAVLERARSIAAEEAEREVAIRSGRSSRGS